MPNNDYNNDNDPNYNKYKVKTNQQDSYASAILRRLYLQQKNQQTYIYTILNTHTNNNEQYLVDKHSIVTTEYESVHSRYWRTIW